MTTRKKHTPKVEAAQVDTAPNDTTVELTDTELDAAAGAGVTRTPLKIFTCPDDADTSTATITDGTSNTFMVGERQG